MYEPQLSDFVRFWCICRSFRYASPYTGVVTVTRVTSHNNIAGVGLCTLVSACFLLVQRGALRGEKVKR